MTNGGAYRALTKHVDSSSLATLNQKKSCREGRYGNRIRP